MVVIVAERQEIPTAWHRGTGDFRPLATRYEELCNRLQAHGLAPIVPMSEHACWEMWNALNQRTEQIANDPRRTAASLQNTETFSRYQRAVAELNKLQKQIPAIINSPAHILLADVPADWDRTYPALRSQTDHRATTAEINSEAAHVLAAALEVENRIAQLDRVLAVEEDDPVTLRRLILALAAREARNNQLLIDRIDHLEDQITRIGHSVQKRKRT
jgi:hypothetical protein